MPASYPASIKSFSTKVDVTDVIYASHPNTMQEEIVAIQSILGVTPSLSTAPVSTGTFISTATTFNTVSARLANIETGIVADVHTQYINKTNGSVTTANPASGVVRNIFTSTSAPGSSDGINGDVWLKYS
jgi:hypothetical protein